MKYSGSIMLLVLVFGGIFFILLASLANFVLGENRAQNVLRARVEAFSIAEAGLTYYQWFLSHFPSDFTNGTGQPGPYVVNYKNPDGDTVGTYSLTIVGSSACGSTQTVDITSTGTPSDYQSVSSILTGRYGAPSVAQYQQIVNDGSTPNITFSNLVSDFGALKDVAEAQGVFLPAHETPQDPHLGYHIIFNADGSITISTVTAVTTMRSVQLVNRPGFFVNDYTLIKTEQFAQTLLPPENCRLIVVEDNVWVEGTVKGKTTLVAGRSVGGGSAPDVILKNNITYADDSSGLTVIGEHNIIIAPDAPMDLTLYGIYVAAEGYFGRNNYYMPSQGCTGLYEPRDDLTIVGTVVSNYPPRTKWPGGCSPGDAGYQTNTHSVEPHNAANPPPFTPQTSSARQFISWQQIK